MADKKQEGGWFKRSFDKDAGAAKGAGFILVIGSAICLLLIFLILKMASKWFILAAMIGIVGYGLYRYMKNVMADD